MDCSARESLDRAKIGNVIVENIRRSDIKALSVTDVALRSLRPAYVVSVWDTSHLQLLFHISGILRESQAVWV